ncbi:MAG: DUF779 domain-containing protein [Oscillatoriales cyanobacterium]|nr:MAG: DUF779 domain-containing protein [Oscillatoriales cyanobacterium]
MPTLPKVTATEAALKLIDYLKTQHGELMFYIAAQQYEHWQHTQLILDVVQGPGGSDFSLEGPDGERFITRSRLFVNVD